MFNKKRVNYPGSANHSWNLIPLGVSGRKEVVWDVSVAPHALICGTTGSGKSVAQRAIIAHCIQHPADWRVVGIDLKRVELSEYKKYDDVVTDVTTSLKESVEALRSISNEMMSRYDELEDQGLTYFKNLPNPPKAIMLVVDEAFVLMADSGGKSDEAKADDKLRAEAAYLINQLTRLGRAAGVHVALAMQNPDAKVIIGELKQNLGFRYGAGRMGSIASSMVFDSDIGRQIPLEPKGSAAISVYGEETTLRGYWVSPEWIDNWYRKNAK